MVSANLLAFEAEKLGGETVNIACGERITINRIIELINQHLGTDIQPEYRDPRPGDVLHSLAAIDAAERAIGYKPLVMFAEGLGRSIEWYQQNAD